MGDRITNRSALVITLYGFAAWQFALAVADAADSLDFQLRLLPLYSAGYYATLALVHLAVAAFFFAVAKPLAARLFSEPEVLDQSAAGPSDAQQAYRADAARSRLP